MCACLKEVTAQTGHNLWNEAPVPSHREFTVHGTHQGVSEFAGQHDRYKGKETHVFRSIGEQESRPPPPNKRTYILEQINIHKNWDGNVVFLLTEEASVDYC